MGPQPRMFGQDSIDAASAIEAKLAQSGAKTGMQWGLSSERTARQAAAERGIATWVRSWV